MKLTTFDLTPTLKIILLFATLTVTSIQAEEAANYPESYHQDESSFMGLLSHLGLHNLEDESWNAYIQGTYISQWQPAFSAAYTNLNGSPNSLLPIAQNSFTATVTPYLSLRLWKGAAFYAAPEMISELPLSNLKGLGGEIQNFELQKTGSEHSTWYLGRSYYRQSISFGGTSTQVTSAPLQLGGTTDSRRFVFSAGRLSVLDIFDKNTYAGDLRHQFFNMAFMANSAYDFAADARGYSNGLAGELYFDNWALRLARFDVPTIPNGLSLYYNLFAHYGDQVEVEHKHVIKGRPGAIKLLGYRNLVNAGKFSDAIAIYQANPAKNATTCTSPGYSSQNASSPGLCWARETNTKVGIGLNMEQSITEDIGTFFRGMYSDGKTEADNYTSADRSLSFGAAMRGNRWGRQKDSLGLGYAQSMLSSSHIQFLSMGGVDQFVGDGAIDYKPERVVDIYYQLHFISSTWLSADYQHITNPGYNAARGPVDVYGLRIHLEF